VSTPLVGIEAARIVYGTRTILDDVSLAVMNDDRIGIVGVNGGGKTTLVEVLAGLREVDSGRVTRTNGVTVSAVGQQRSDVPEALLLGQFLFGDAPSHTWASKPLVRDVLDGLIGGMQAVLYPFGMTTAMGSMSGGQRRKAELAKALMEDPDLLILDEPTNHLEIEAIDWLAAFISRRRSATMIVTHDRWFLDAACATTWEVVDGQVHKYEGGYAAFILARAERQRRDAVTEERRQNLLRTELAWLRRGAPARTSKPKFRIAAAEALIADVPPPRDSVSLASTASARLGKKIVNIENASFSIGVNSPTVFGDVTWHLAPGVRYGLLGPNGIGKSTMINAIADACDTPVTVHPHRVAGRIDVGTTVVIGMLSQVIEETPGEASVLGYIESLRPTIEIEGVEVSARSLLERFGFRGNRLTTFVRDLSGGERRRLALLTVLLGSPNVLLLDEPTNDLDTDTAAEFESLLDTWPGTVVSVSHDRYFLERTCDQMYALLPTPSGAAALRHLPGGIEQYLALRAPVQAPPPAKAAAAAPTAGLQGSALHTARKNIQRIERRLEKIEQLQEDVAAQLTTNATDYEHLQAVAQQAQELADEREQLEAEWLEISADIEG